jgi:subfamily B ATP-binding cassette protein MsbA
MKPTDFKSPTRLLLAFLFQYKAYLVILVFLWLGTAGLAAAQPLVMAPMVQIAIGQSEIATSEAQPVSISNFDLNNVDQLITSLLGLKNLQPWDIVLALSGIFLTLALIGTLLDFVAFYFLTRVRVSILRSLQEYVFKHLLSLSLDFFNQQRTGSLVSRLEQDATASVNSLAGILKSATIAPVMALIYGFMLVRTNLQLMLLVSIVGAAQWFAARLLRNQIRKYVTAEFDLIASVHAYLTEIFQNIRVVKSFVAEKFENIRLSKKFSGMIPVHVRRAISKHGQEPLVAIINAIGNISILLLSTRELLDGNLTVVGFFLFLYVGRAMIQPISQMAQIYSDYQEMSAAATRVYGILQVRPTIVDGGFRQTNFSRSIQFKNVSFSYSNEPVLSHVDVKIDRGQTIALVGPSGAGKSTFTDLLLRFYDPSEGFITIDGRDLRDLEIASYRSLFGVVAQENLLFNDTIASNIIYGRARITRKQMIAAAEAANAAEFIATLPNGYETLVGDRGIRLSGGQRQRIAIARAIVHQPEILILDEATSSLDTVSERQVQAAIDQVVQGRTSVIIAHRLSTVLHAEKIIVLENGQILDEGRHAELYERCALYKRLCDLQFHIDEAPLAQAES